MICLTPGEMHRSGAALALVTPSAVLKSARSWALLGAVLVAASIFAAPALATNRINVAPGPNGLVSVISGPDTNGTRYLGGAFTAFDAWDTGSGALVSASTASVNSSFSRVTGGSIFASAADGAGGFYIGGDFTAVDGVERNRAAHIKADGSLDPTWNPNLNADVAALAVSGSTVYLGGYFTYAGDTRRNRAAAVGTDGTLNPTWDPNLNDGVAALAVSGSTVYLGGWFTSSGGTTRNYAAPMMA
ncbi:MAG: delta-60 repeat domain-containing protein [Solirubrobacterales bacterium]|nr:delta-60 repeat domain-containing protein [Solirubrobacterales bacterium]